MIREIKENKVDAKTRKRIRESNVSAADLQRARPNHHKIQSIIDRYELNPETVLNDMLAYFPDSTLAEFAADMQHDYCDDDDGE